MSSKSGGKKSTDAAARKGGKARASWALAMLLAAYLALATAYNFATPVGVSPDELGHAEYIRYVVAHHRPPVFGPRGLVYEAHQPPLYYFLAAPVWAAAGSGPEPARLRLTEWHQRAGIYVLSGRAAVQGRAVRLLTTLIGAIGLALIWALVGVLSPGDRWLRIAATALAAFLPMRLALAAAVSNDLLLEALFTASLLAMALMIRRGYTHRRAWALGAAIGAAMLTKTTAVLLLLPALITLVIVSSRRRSPDPERQSLETFAPRITGAWRLAFGIRAIQFSKAVLHESAKGRKHERKPTKEDRRRASLPVFPVIFAFSPFRVFARNVGQMNGPAFGICQLDAGLLLAGCLRAFGIAALLAGPWLLRNRILYGDFLAARAFAAYFTQVQSTPQALMAHLGMTPARFWIKVVGLWTYSSFWGVFGPFTVWMAPSVYHALLVPTAMAPVGLVLQSRRGPRSAGEGVPAKRAQRACERRGHEVGGGPAPGPQGQPDERQRTIWWVLALSLVLVVFAYVRYNLLIVEPQSRFLLAAMAPIALLLTLGWLAFVPRRARPAATAGMALGMAALAIYAVAGIILPYYR